MLDRYTKAVLTVIALSLALLAVDSVSVSPTARAQSTPRQKRCVWTHIVDTDKYDLGENGEVKLGREWLAVSEGGWELKSGTSFGQYRAFLYVFERCESK